MVLELSRLEKVLLPNNCEFTTLQKRVIDSKGSADVVAGPGSGKTTVLMAKFAMLLTEFKESKQGICIITHTNVAVEEVKLNLKKIGVDEIKYPNFIGTIHEFFNYFFTKIAFNELFINEDIYEYEILDSEQYKERFKEQFEIYKNSNYTYSAPVSLVDNLQIELTQNNEKTFNIRLNGYCKNFYKDAAHESFRALFRKGILRHIDTLSICEWYINKHKDKIKKSFIERFSWVIMDESQDASQFQFDLLDKIIDAKKISYQRYGDPYQALYNDSTENVWKPGEFTEEQLSESTRFGNNIAKVLKTTCIEEYNKLNGSPNKYSYKPHLFIFSDKKGLITRYKELIKELEVNSKEFKQSKKKVSVLAVEHAPLEDYKDNYVRVKNSKPSSENLLRTMYNEVLRIYLRNLKYSLGGKKFSFSEFLKLINKDLLNEKAKIAIGLKSAFNNAGIIEESNFVNSYSSIAEKLNVTVDKKIEASVSQEVKEAVQKIYLSSRLQNELVSNSNEEDLYFGTVHGVKGETHKATILIDTAINIKYDNKWKEFSLFKLIESYLFGLHTNVDKFEGIEKAAIIKALKSAYVALSRPTHLTSVAVNEQEYDKDIDKLILKAEQNNWVVIKV